MVLAEELIRRRLAVQDALDLGCGLGLVGAVAASQGIDVFMGDAAPPALLFARLNSWPWRDHVRVRQLNWRHDQLDQCFSLITGSDIVYDRDEWPYLDRFWRRHLAAGGTILLAEPGRRSGTEFVSWIRQQDWRLEQFAVTPEAGGRPIGILELQRR